MNKYTEKLILNEFTRHPHISGNIISIIMKQLDDYDKKNKFLSFMIDNRGILLDKNDLVQQLKILKEN